MAVHDHDRRTARDYVHGARARYDRMTTGTKWTAMLIGLALLAFVAYMMFAADPNPTFDAIRQTPPTPQTTTAPSTTTTAPTTQPAPAGPTTQPQ
jgi:hypothetical protein